MKCSSTFYAGLAVAVLGIGCGEDGIDKNPLDFVGLLTTGPSKILFWSDRGDEPGYYVADADGSNLVDLCPERGAGDRMSIPSWSPDGSRLAFSVGDRICVVNADGSGLFYLTGDSTRAVSPSWSPDGTLLAFFVYRDEKTSDATDAYLMDVASGNLNKLVELPEGEVDYNRHICLPDFTNNPLWSPDGRQIAFNLAGKIVIADIDGSTLFELPDEGSGGFYYSPTLWSPDGGRLIFQAMVDGDREICAMDADGGNMVNLSGRKGDDIVASWSPDGAWIAYLASVGDDREIYVMDADGSNPVNLTNDPATDWFPLWSPDGDKILFEADREDDREIFVMDADGSNLVNLTNDPGVDLWPIWSPDGRQIAFCSRRDGDQEVYVMDADGSNSVNVTNHPAEEWLISWSLR